MNLEIICKYLEDNKIKYHKLIKENGYVYLHIFEDGDTYNSLYVPQIEENMSLHSELQFNKFFEFKDKKLVSYSNEYFHIIKKIFK